MGYLIWAGWLVIAITDARENRIPNIALLYLLVLTIAYQSFSHDPLLTIGGSLVAGLVMFLGGFALYIARAMAPGDVKLLGVVGVVMGWGQLLDTVFWIAISSVLVGLLYGSMRMAEDPKLFQQMIRKYTMILSYGRAYGRGSKVEGDMLAKSNAQMLRMPFAPVVVIGLAMQSYF
ncbi:prepilin peptidase [Vibrio sp. YMD68]|uniref:prepilin peptidase n=1 Tax=Vibrio sp. YMD68 TaxID=3042300 RepID=UPI00249C719A|nr:prepilin peptidase [Vibrio sp. YMD68]WGV99772.1 prepilin peptidase [Vibrio sp. YMD68]